MQTDNTIQDAPGAAADRNDAEAKPRALSDLALATVVGGTVTMQDFHFVIKVNK